MLAIIGAMEEEVAALLERMEEPKKQIISHVEFYTGKLAGYPVVLSRSGVAKTQAAISTTVLFEHFDVEGVINIGTAGGLQDMEQVLDVVVSNEVVHHDVDVTAMGWTRSTENKRICFTAEPRYVECVRSIITENDRVFVGLVASGDSFIAREDQVEEILRYYPDALCSEMEAAAVAQVCTHYGKPFVVVRSLSDITLRPGNEMTFDEYVLKASARSAIWCEKFVAALHQED